MEIKVLSTSHFVTHVIKHTQNLPRVLVTVKIIPYLLWWLAPSQYSAISRDICKKGDREINSSIFISGA